MRDKIGMGARSCPPRRGWVALLCLVASACLGWAAERDVVINEILYNPPGNKDALQFVELFNRGDSAVDLSGWSFAKGIKFTFPRGTKIAPEGYLVICQEPVAFSAHYGRELATVGPFTGRLSHKSDRLEIANAAGETIDSVKYSDGPPWPAGADGYSSSLERICPFSETDVPENWAASPVPATKQAAGTPGAINASFSTNLPPAIVSVEFTPKLASPQQTVTVKTAVRDSDGLKAVTLFYRTARMRRESGETAVPMRRLSGDDLSGTYEAAIPAQPQGQLVRFRIQATDRAGTERIEPSPNEPRPAYSYFSFTNAAGAARIPIGHLVNVSAPARGPRQYEPAGQRRTALARPVRGNGAFLYVPPSGEPETFDFVRIAGRHGGYKVHFQKDRTLKGMTGINLISEGPTRWILAEPLAYTVYRMAEVPAPLTEHVRLSMDGRALGFHLLVEQPNEGFLERNGRALGGNLYKVVWFGQGLEGQHEKKTNRETGHGDLIQLVQGLDRKSGADQWQFIEQNFNVEEAINYYVVNMCIQNWDGFFNNYYTYHDTTGSGRWEIYPWDEDKTWGDYDGASPRYNWYTMPLNYGANTGNQPRNFSQFGFGGGNWWRPPGIFSGPLLANREFRARFLARLREFCLTQFTEESLFPIIDAMEKRLEPEVRLRAHATGQNPQMALGQFSGHMRSFRSQVENRRKFILTELAKAR